MTVFFWFKKFQPLLKKSFLNYTQSMPISVRRMLNIGTPWIPQYSAMKPPSTHGHPQ